MNRSRSFEANRTATRARTKYQTSIIATSLVGAVLLANSPSADAISAPSTGTKVDFATFETAFNDGIAELYVRSSRIPDRPESASEARVHDVDRDVFEAWGIEAAARLRRHLGDAFAGAALHPVDHRLFVGTTTMGHLEAELLPRLLTGHPYHLTLVDVTTTEIQRQLVSENLAEYGLANYTLMTLEDRVRIFVNNPEELHRTADALAMDELRFAFDSLTHDHPLEIDAVAVYRGTMSLGKDSLSSGVANFRSSGTSYCTFGPNMVRIATGVRYATTSGHCDQPIYRNGHRFPLFDSRNTSAEDWAIHSIPSSMAPGLGYVWVSPSWSIPIHGPWRSSMTGTSRSMKGRVSHYTTGTYVGTRCGRPVATYSRAPGDSGGPVLYPYGEPRAAGIHEGPCEWRDPDGRIWTHSAYTPIYSVELAGGSSPRFRVLRFNE